TGEHVLQAILEIENLILLDNGDYICKAKNPLGIAQSTLPLRVRKPELPLLDEEHIMNTRDLEPCDAEENHCFNDGQCFFKKSDPLDRRCRKVTTAKRGIWGISVSSEQLAYPLQGLGSPTSSIYWASS
ncbi:hypothetical protein ACTXT7_016121, partial [Hymenolepis weldensis]